MKNADKPAYPLPKDRMMSDEKSGLTKREMFAMAAMQGIVSKEAWLERMLHEESDKSLINQIATTSIKIADELLKQLES